jgi:hypothetical protein
MATKKAKAEKAAPSTEPAGTNPQEKAVAAACFCQTDKIRLHVRRFPAHPD